MPTTATEPDAAKVKERQQREERDTQEIPEQREKREAELQKLLAPVSAEAPAGASMEYDPEYLRLERIAAGTPGGQFSPAVEPNWEQVKKVAYEVALRSKDLRVVVHLATAWLKTEGIIGFRDGVFLLKGTIDGFWDNLYPNLDPDDKNDPTERMNILRVYASRDDRGVTSDMVRDLRLAPLTRSPQIGRFGIKDILAATTPAPGGSAAAKDQAEGGDASAQKVDIALIEAAAKDTTLALLKQTEAAAVEAAAIVSALAVAIDERVGAKRGIALKDVIDSLQSAATHLRRFLALQGVGGTTGAGEGEMTTLDGDVSMADDGLTGGTGAVAISGEIRSRADVAKMIEKICTYYAKVEPSSPVPLLLRRAQRLLDKDFWGVIMDLSPDAAAQVQAISGTPPPEPPAP